MKLPSSPIICRGILPLAALFACAGANASTLLTYSAAASSTARSDGPYNVGSIFTVNTVGLQITQLGVMDVDNVTKSPGSNGFVAPISVGLWSWDGSTATQLGSTITVTSTDTLDNGYRYVTLATPIALISGQQYILGANVGAGREYFLDNATTAIFSASSANFTLNKSTYATGGTLAAPTSDGNLIGRWGAANAIVTAVPEAGYPTALMGGAGLLCLVRRRQKRAKTIFRG